MRLTLAALMLTATPALAGVEEAIDDHVLPNAASFAEATSALADTARDDCTAGAVKPAWNDAFDAWMGISHLQLGPLEEGGRTLAIAFWPDSRGMAPRAIAGIVADEDPVVGEADAFAEVSVAARGLFAMERLLYGEDYAGYGADSYVCRLVEAMAVDLSRLAGEVDTAWRDDFAPTLRSAGEAGNDRFLDRREAAQALYTALMTGLTFTETQRLARPMGSFDRPRPEQAEARRSGRSLRNVILSLEALRGLAGTLSNGDIPQTEAAFDAALETARELDDPVLAGVSDPQGRLEVEVLKQRVEAIRRAVDGELGAALGVSQGFNSMDGD